MKRPGPSPAYIPPIKKDANHLTNEGRRLKGVLEKHVLAVLATTGEPMTEAALEHTAGFSSKSQPPYLVSSVLPPLAAQGLVVVTKSGTVMLHDTAKSRKAEKRREHLERNRAVRDRLTAGFAEWRHLSRPTAELYARKRFGAFFASGGTFEDIWT